MDQVESIVATVIGRLVSALRSTRTKGKAHTHTHTRTRERETGKEKRGAMSIYRWRLLPIVVVYI